MRTANSIGAMEIDMLVISDKSEKIYSHSSQDGALSLQVGELEPCE